MAAPRSGEANPVDGPVSARTGKPMVLYPGRWAGWYDHPATRLTIAVGIPVTVFLIVFVGASDQTASSGSLFLINIVFWSIPMCFGPILAHRVKDRRPLPRWTTVSGWWALPWLGVPVAGYLWLLQSIEPIITRPEILIAFGAAVVLGLMATPITARRILRPRRAADPTDAAEHTT